MITLHRAAIEDFLTLAELDRAAWKRYPHGERVPDGEHVWRLWVEHALVYCAKENDQIMGVIVAFLCRSGEWCVHKAFVHENYRRQQIGSRLFDLLLREIDGLGAGCFLTVDPANTAAIRLYEKWGFAQKQFFKDYYRPGEDRYVMARSAGKRAATKS